MAKIEKIGTGSAAGSRQPAYRQILDTLRTRISNGD